MSDPQPAAPRGSNAELARRRRFWWVFGTIGVLAMSAVAIWFGIAAASGLSWNSTGFEVVDDQHIDVRFDVMRDPTRPVTCQLEAQDEDHSVVGSTSVEVPATASAPSRHVFTVRTVTRAVTGYVDSCAYTTP